MSEAYVTDLVSRLAPVGSEDRSALTDAALRHWEAADGSTSGGDTLRAWLSAELVLWTAVERGLLIVPDDAEGTG